MSRISWTNPVEFIKPGEPVSADVANRPDRQIADRVNAVRDRVTGLEGRVVLYEQACDPTVVAGEAVYFDKTANRFQKALAVTQVANGQILPADSAEVIGLVLKKVSGGIADVVTFGLIYPDVVTPMGETGPVTAEGTYYLSARIAGRLTAALPSTPIRVAVYDSSLGTVVAVDKPTSFDQHRHYRFDLVSKAAAHETAYLENGVEKVVLSNANSALGGWLPATDPVFDGTAPAGAVFGYNLSTDAAVRAVWPPAPVDAADLVVFFDSDHGFGKEYPREYVTFDKNGIWLKTNIVSQLPWKVLSTPAGGSSSLQPFGDNRGNERQAALYFHKTRYAADRTAVTTLAPNDPTGPIKIVDCNGDNAVAGDLLLVYDPTTEVTTNADEAPIAVKSFVKGGLVTRGPVMTGLIPGDDTIVLESDDVRPADPNLPLGDRAYYGKVTIRAAFDASERLIYPQLTQLNGVQQRYADETYLSLGLKQNTSYVYQFALPGAVGFPTNPKVSLRLWLLSNAATTIPGLAIAVRRLPRALVGTALPNTPQALTFVSPGIVAVGSYVETETADALTVAASDVVNVTITRAASDGYAGDVQILNACLRLFQGS